MGWAAGLAAVLLLAFIVSRQFHPLPNTVAIPQPGDRPIPTSGTNPGSDAVAKAPEIAGERQKESMAAELNKTANDLLRARHPAAAAQAYRQALALTPKDEDLHLNLGIAYSRLGDVTNAENEYREALKLLPDYPEVHNNLGALLMRQGRLAEAEEHLTEAVKQMPEYAQAHNNLGILRQRQHRANEALLCFQKAVQCETNFPEAHYNLAGAYLSANERDKAIAELRETLRLNPGFEIAQRTLARILGEGSNAPPAPLAPR